VNTSPKDPLFGILPQVADLLVKTIDDWLQTISFDSFLVLPTVRTELKNIPLIEGSESAIKEGDFGEVTYVENSKMSVFSRLIEFLHSILKFEEQTKRYWHYAERILW
jgi:hypothetical protein